MSHDPKPWQRPPFEPGNTVSTKHGARSERKIAPLARQILDELLADESLPAYLRDPSYRGAMAGLARCEAVVSLLEQYVATLTIEDAISGAFNPLEQLRRWLNTAQTHRRALGLDPLSRGQLGRDVAVAQANAADAVAQLAADGAQVRAQRADRDAIEVIIDDNVS